MIVIRRCAACSRAWCEGCAGVASFMSPEEAAAAAGVTTRVIYQWLEAGRLHFWETAEGQTMICLNSAWNLRQEACGKPASSDYSG